MSKTTILSAALLTTFAATIEQVTVAEDKVVCIREMTAGAREEYEQACAVKGTTQIRATLLSMTVCDEAGVLMFTKDDIPKLQALPVAMVLKIYDAAAIMNGLKTAAVDKAEKE